MSIKFLIIIVSVFLVACGGDENLPMQDDILGTPENSISISGAVQKGPFIVGTPVFVNKLDKFGNASESTVITKIEDSIGSFSFKINGIGPVQIISNGYYFSELSGQISSGTLTLKAIYNTSSKNYQTVYVNILTHLINDRVLELIKFGKMDIDNAILQAQRELVTALNPVLPIVNIANFNALSVYNTNFNNANGNAYLLALSTAFYKYAEIKATNQNTSADAQLSLILNQIAKDFSDDGLIQQPSFINDLTAALRKLNAKGITENLKQRSSIDFSAPLDIPDITKFFGLCAGAADCMWSSGAPMPIPRRGHASAVYNKKIYIFGGTTPNDYTGGMKPANTLHTDVYEYDTETNQWSQKQSMPIGLFDLQAHTIGDKIYIFGGYSDGGFKNTVMEFDPINNSWKEKTSMPTYRYTFMSEEINGRVYIIGGQGTIDNGPWESGKPWEFKKHVEIYDPQKDSWSNGAFAPSNLANAASCSIKDDIYIFGGYTGGASSTSNTYVYNVTTNTWAIKSSATIARSSHACVSVGNDFFVIGGANNLISSPKQLDVIELYSVRTDTWKKVAFLPTARYWFSAGVVGDKIYIIGGNGGDLSDLLNVVEVIDTSMIEK